MIEENQTKRNDISPLLIQDEMKSSYLDYAMSVIVGRALPDVRDGLKPVHRRILFAMHLLNTYFNRPYVKSARIVGEVIGKYHPHGDSSVYGTMVRLAQDFSMRYQLIDGQGNFGSIDGDNAAAMRYTEVRMKKITAELLKDIDRNTVEWQPNYDDSLKEPIVLPTKIPNLLINGSTGIAVGMATNIPPHNLNEIMEGLLALIDNPETSIEQLVKIIPGPDFPTAGSIHGISGIKSAYFTGKGIIQIRAKAEIEVHEKSGREKIIVSELPYQVLKSKLIEKIAYMVNNKEIEGISDIRDESNRLGIRVVIEIKKGEMAQVVLNRLYKHTQLQISYGIIFLAIHNGAPKVMNIKEMLTFFIDHRREVIIRRTHYDLNKARERAHILEGLKVAVENIDPIIKLIKAASNPHEARTNLIQHYSLSEIQANAILEMRLQRLTGLEQKKIIEEYEAVLKEIISLEEIIASDELVNQIMREEFSEVKENYGDERKTCIIADANEIMVEDLIKNESVIVTITRKGYVKRMALDTYKSQRRGGKGVKGADLDDDFYTNIFTADTHSNILFFTNKGTMFCMKVYQVPEGSRTSKGRNVINLLPVPPGETIKEIIPVPDDYKGKFLVIATEQGVVKRTSLEEYKNVKQSGLRAIKILDGDSVVNVRVTNGDKDMFLCSSSGKTIRFAETDCRAQGRVSQGVKGINLEEKEKVIGMEIIDEQSLSILTITENGYGKRTLTEEYRKQSRSGKGILAMKLTPKTGDIVQIKPVSDKDDLMIITDFGQVIRIKIAGISQMGRTTQGVRLINVKDGEKVVAVENILEEDNNLIIDGDEETAGEENGE